MEGCRLFESQPVRKSFFFLLRNAFFTQNSPLDNKFHILCPCSNDHHMHAHSNTHKHQGTPVKTQPVFKIPLIHVKVCVLHSGQKKKKNKKRDCISLCLTITLIPDAHTAVFKKRSILLEFKQASWKPIAQSL